MTCRVAVVVSHPIQHFCPQYASWARLPGVDLRVLFASAHGLKPYHDKNFGRVVAWEGLRTDFPHEFLDGAEQRTLGTGVDAPTLGARLAAFSPHAVVVYGYSQRLQQRAIAWAVAARVPLLMISDSELRAPRPLARRAAKAVVLPLLYRRVALFLTVGDANEAYYRSYGVSDDRMVRQFFPIDVAAYDRALVDRDAARARVRRAHGIPDDHRVVLNVGKLVAWKRQQDLVDLANRWAAPATPLTVVLAGTGPDEAALRARVAPGAGVVFAGFVPPTTLIDYYCAADAYAHASSSEPHSLAISEAIYCGLPVICSDRCGSYGPTDDVRSGLNGRVYPCGDVGALARAVERVVGDPGARAAMGEASARLGRAHQALAHGGALAQAVAALGLPRA